MRTFFLLYVVPCNALYVIASVAWQSPRRESLLLTQRCMPSASDVAFATMCAFGTICAKYFVI